MLKQQKLKPIDEIQYEVLAYLEEHPDAADSVDAIQRWWLLERLARISKMEVSNALKQLVDSQLLGRRVLGDGREIYYRRNKWVPAVHKKTHLN